MRSFNRGLETCPVGGGEVASTQARCSRSSDASGVFLTRQRLQKRWGCADLGTQPLSHSAGCPARGKKTQCRFKNLCSRALFKNVVHNKDTYNTGSHATNAAPPLLCLGVRILLGLVVGSPDLVCGFVETIWERKGAPLNYKMPWVATWWLQIVNVKRKYLFYCIWCPKA